MTDKTLTAEEYRLGDKVLTEEYKTEVFTVVGIRETELELNGDWSGGTHNVSQNTWYPVLKCKRIDNYDEYRNSLVKEYDDRQEKCNCESPIGWLTNKQYCRNCNKLIPKDK